MRNSKQQTTIAVTLAIFMVFFFDGGQSLCSL